LPALADVGITNGAQTTEAHSRREFFMVILADSIIVYSVRRMFFVIDCCWNNIIK
jgi:hypothetical protein